MSVLHERKVTKLRTDYLNDEREKQQNFVMKRRKLIRRLTGVGICAAIFFTVIITTLFNQSTDIETRLEKKQMLESKLIELKEQEKLQRNEIMKLNDEEYVAKIARDEFFFSDEGEVIFKIAD